MDCYFGIYFFLPDQSCHRLQIGIHSRSKVGEIAPSNIFINYGINTNNYSGVATGGFGGYNPPVSLK